MRTATALMLALITTQPAAALVMNPRVDPAAPGTLVVRWTAKDAVDIYRAATPDSDVAAATLVAKNDRDGREVVGADPSRRYFLLRDTSDGSVTRVAERVLPLAQGSNFRDIGGYPAAGGKHVRWGTIFRSGATPVLTAADLQEIQDLGLRTMVDLRSTEERQIAPTRIEGVTYTSYNYSIRDMMRAAQAAAKGAPNGAALYVGLPTGLAPQLRIVFASLLRKDVPLVYNCTAGQDRTGFTTAMILSALGVPRDAIYKDYLLSTQYRRPQFEIPPIDEAMMAKNPIARFFVANAQIKPQPLVDANGQPFLQNAFAEIDRKWGSVDAYLNQEVGLTPADLATLKTLYLE